MTVCIAAACQGSKPREKYLILCSDRLGSSYYGSSETLLKIFLLAGKWRLLVAGDHDEIKYMNMRFSKIFIESEIDKVSFTEETALSLVRSVLNERKKEKANELTNSRYGINYSDFLAQGRVWLPQDSFRELLYDVRQAEIRAEFIVAGFSNSNDPIIIETARDGCAYLREDFAVIGGGSFLARSSLAHREFYDLDPLGVAIYSVYEAKKLAEREVSVGKDTLTLVVPPDGKAMKLMNEAYTWLSQLYHEYGPKALQEITIPDGIMKNISEL